MIGDRIEQDGQTFEIVGNMDNGWSLIRYVYPASEKVCSLWTYHPEPYLGDEVFLRKVEK